MKTKRDGDFLDFRIGVAKRAEIVMTLIIVSRWFMGGS